MTTNTKSAQGRTASIDLVQLDSLDALTQSYLNENSGHWYSGHQLADGITLESAAAFIAAANPATVQQLIQLARRSLTSGAPAQSTLDDDEMTRLRRLMKALGMDGSFNAPDAYVRGILCTVLGQAAGRIELAGAATEVPSRDSGQEDASTQTVRDPVVEANRKLLLDRSQVGIEKYGTTLAGAALSRPQIVHHALEEALDLANYLQTLLRSEHAIKDGSMIDIEKLKALALAANLNNWPFHGVALQKAANPAAVLELIAEVERLRAELAAGAARQGGNTSDSGIGSDGAAGTVEKDAARLAHGHRQDYYLLANARRVGLLPIHQVVRMPNWVLASELFATGSTSAHKICVDAGIDPYAIKVERAAIEAHNKAGKEQG